jgi:hypothetical protein
VVGGWRHVELGGVDVRRSRCYFVHEELGIELVGGAARGRKEREVTVAEVVRAEKLLGEAGLLLLAEVWFPKLVVIVWWELVVIRVEAFVRELLAVVACVACVVCADVESQADWICTLRKGVRGRWVAWIYMRWLMAHRGGSPTLLIHPGQCVLLFLEQRRVDGSSVG